MKHSHASQPRRLLLVTTGLGIGGAESQVVSLAAEFKKRGWDVAVVALLQPTANAERLQGQLIPVYSLGMAAGIPDVRGIFRLRSLVRRIQPDIVHCHMFHANLLGRITRLFCPIPTLICTAHGTHERSRLGGPTWHKDLLYRVTDPLCDLTTIICRQAFDRYVRTRAVPRHKLRVVPNGVDTDIFAPSDVQKRQARRNLGLGSQFVWIAVGRLVVQKDYPNLLRAAEMLRGDFTLLVAGGGPLEHRLREICFERNLRGHVRFCGACENTLDLYRAADGFVLSSQEEGLPIALLEAASTGLPAVVTKVGGAPDVVVDGLTGYVVEPADPVKLAASMQRMMNATPADRNQMAAAARQQCVANYSIESITDQWGRVYSEHLPVHHANAVVEGPRAEPIS